jgi:hypothetical protein
MKNMTIKPEHAWVEAGPDGLPTQEAFDAWPNCRWPGCENKSCGPLDSSLCFPHTIQLRGITAEQGRAEIHARREQAFGKGCDDLQWAEQALRALPQSIPEKEGQP